MGCGHHCCSGLIALRISLSRSERPLGSGLAAQQICLGAQEPPGASLAAQKHNAAIACACRSTAPEGGRVKVTKSSCSEGLAASLTGVSGAVPLLLLDSLMLLDEALHGQQSRQPSHLDTAIERDRQGNLSWKSTTKNASCHDEVPYHDKCVHAHVALHKHACAAGAKK
jgi:hypothetical protein